MSTWRRVEGDGEPLFDDREDGLSLYARDLIASRPPVNRPSRMTVVRGPEPPAPRQTAPQPALRVLRPSDPVEAAQGAPEAAVGAPSVPPWRMTIRERWNPATRTWTTLGGRAVPVPPNVTGIRLWLRDTLEHVRRQQAEQRGEVPPSDPD